MPEGVVEMDLSVGADQLSVAPDHHHGVVDPTGDRGFEHPGDDRQPVLNGQALKLVDEWAVQRFGKRCQALIQPAGRHDRLWKQRQIGAFGGRRAGKLADLNQVLPLFAPGCQLPERDLHVPFRETSTGSSMSSTAPTKTANASISAMIVPISAVK